MNITKNPASGARGKRRQAPQGPKVTCNARLREDAGSFFFKMSLKEKLQDDLRAALRSGEDQRKGTLRMVLAALHNAEIEAGGDLEESAVLAVLAKEAKQRRESIEEFRKGRREDLVAREEAELAIIQEYLPQQMTREEIVEAAGIAIAEVGASGPADKGKVMPLLVNRLRGRADGREINAVVTELLAGPR